MFIFHTKSGWHAAKNLFLKIPNYLGHVWNGYVNFLLQDVVRRYVHSIRVHSLNSLVGTNADTFLKLKGYNHYSSIQYLYAHRSRTKEQLR